MALHPRFSTSRSIVLCLSIAVAACLRESDHPTSPRFVIGAGPGGDPEVFGNVYENGQRTTRTDLLVTIAPLDPETQSHLRSRFDSIMWVNPADIGGYPKGRMFGWFDPNGGDNCGGLGPYEQGDSTARAQEVHRRLPSVPPDTSTREAHCIRPGKYRFTLSTVEGQVLRSYQFEYLAARLLSATDAATGAPVLVEPTSYDTVNTHTDHILHVDLATSASFATPVIRMQNSHANPEGGTFADEASVQANEADWLRFSSLTSTGLSWTGDQLGRALARYHWDYGGTNAPPPYFVDDRNLEPLLRVHRFDHVRETRPVTVGLDLLQPNNDPAQLPLPATRTISFTRLGPVACFALETSTSWRLTDQYLNAACSSRGTSIRYRWQSEAGGV